MSDLSHLQLQGIGDYLCGRDRDGSVDFKLFRANALKSYKFIIVYINAIYADDDPDSTVSPFYSTAVPLCPTKSSNAIHNCSHPTTGPVRLPAPQ